MALDNKQIDYRAHFPTFLSICFQLLSFHVCMHTAVQSHTVGFCLTRVLDHLRSYRVTSEKHQMPISLPNQHSQSANISGKAPKNLLKNYHSTATTIILFILICVMLKPLSAILCHINLQPVSCF